MRDRLILNSYNDAFGNEIFVSQETKDLIIKELTSIENSLPQIVVLEERELYLQLPCEKLNWKIYSANNLLVQGESYREGSGFILKLDLPIGYYDLELCNLEHKLLLVSAPSRAYLPESLFEKKHWGLITQLYSLTKSEKDSFGDFAALRDFKKIAKEQGASFVGLNPLLATGFPNNIGISPYSPVSRFALSEIYISTSLPERKSDLIDYQFVANHKHRELFQRFQIERNEKYEVSKELNDYAIFSALRNEFGPEWRKWPVQYQQPVSSEVLKFGLEHKEQIDYYIFLQQLARNELASFGNKDFSNDVVLYLDFPVGVSLNSSDVWANQDLYALNASAGAPPDELAPQGQSWGLPPMIPERLLEQKCQPFIQALRFTMQYAGAVRIDHVMSLWRLYWAMPNGDGAYVRYPARELTSILKLESHLNKCVVIGEDLGTVPEETKQFMSNSAVLSYKVFYFEKEGDSFKSPENYPKESLCCVGTHDLATLKGFIKKTDLDERANLNLHNKETLDRLFLNREVDLEALKRFLALDSLENFDQVLDLLNRRLKNSNSLLVAIQLEDLFGQNLQVNLPGTVDERPNWKMMLGAAIDKFRT